MRASAIRLHAHNSHAVGMIVLLCTHLGTGSAQTTWPPVSGQAAASAAVDHLTIATGQQLGSPTLVILKTHGYPAWGPTWNVSFDLSDGGSMSASVDPVSAEVWSWTWLPARYSYATDGGLVPRVSADDAQRIASGFLETHYPALGRRRLRPGDELLVSQYTFIVGWDVILDPMYRTLGPTPVIMQVDHQNGNVLGVELPYVGPIVVDTRPTVSAAQITTIARRHALLDPDRYPVAHVDLRVSADDHGAQRLVYECFQYPGLTRHPMYGVVFDAHTGEPLYPIAPFGGTKYPARQIRFPKRASVRMKPLDRPLTTQLSPAVLRGGLLWLRAEHLRAVEGVRVDVARDRVTVHVGGKTLNQADLGAQWRDYGWWVPLRHAAKLVGWQVDWNSAKKEATIRTGG